MISKDQRSSITNRRPKRKFTLSDEQGFYKLWKTSGLTKTRFCQEQGLAFSVFAKWCRNLEKTPMDSKNNWIPIVAKEKIPEIKKESGVIEIKEFNVIKSLIFLLLLIQCLKVFFDAINFIW
jgi:hypothetical protein